MGKSVGMLTGQAEPTIIQPPMYKKRFIAAMERYFMTVPVSTERKIVVVIFLFFTNFLFSYIMMACEFLLYCTVMYDIGLYCIVLFCLYLITVNYTKYFTNRYLICFTPLPCLPAAA